MLKLAEPDPGVVPGATSPGCSGSGTTRPTRWRRCWPRAWPARRPPRRAPACSAFRPLAHRMELVAEADGVAYYDDSKGTNVGAVVAALDGFPRPVVLIAGGRDKGGDYAPLAEALGAGRARGDPHRRGGRQDAGGVRRRRCRSSARRRWRRRSTPPGDWRARATPSCCRPPARASTCSATTPTAPRSSAPPVARVTQAGSAQ